MTKLSDRPKTYQELVRAASLMAEIAARGLIAVTATCPTHGETTHWNTSLEHPEAALCEACVLQSRTAMKIGAKGGKSKSPAKAAASRLNGIRGGKR